MWKGLVSGVLDQPIGRLKDDDEQLRYMKKKFRLLCKLLMIDMEIKIEKNQNNISLYINKESYKLLFMICIFSFSV